MSNRFLAYQRIRKLVEFQRVLKHGRRLSLGCFTVYYDKTDQDFSRLGMIIAKKYCKLAVGRNRLKRLIRECFRHNHEKWQGWDVVLMLRHPVNTLSDEEQVQCLKELFLAFDTFCSR